MKYINKIRAIGSMNIDFILKTFVILKRKEREQCRECELRVNFFFFFKHRRNFQCLLCWMSDFGLII